MLLSSSTLLINRDLRPMRPLSSRLFNTNASRYSDDDDDESGDDRRFKIDRRRSPSTRPGFAPFADVSTTPISTRNLSQFLNMMDQINELPVASGFPQLPYNVKETKDALYLRADMPGLGKEDVKLSLEQNTLIIKGEGKKEFEDDEGVRDITDMP